MERRPFPVFLVALLVLAAGGLLSSVAGTSTYLVRLLLLAGSALLVLAGVRSLPRLRFLFGRMRTVAEPGPALTLLLAGSVLLVVAVGWRIQPIRLDATSRGLNSLSSSSVEALGRPGRSVEMIGVYRAGTAGEEQARDILRIYSTSGRGITARLLDPDKEPERARELGIRFSSGVLVRADSISETVTELSESALTQAVLRVRDPERPVMVLLEGHGETGPGRAGLVRLRQLLREAGFEVRGMSLSAFQDLPPEIRAVWITGPSTELLPGEQALLRSFLAGGGRLAVFLDPETRTGVEEILKSRGVLIDGRRARDEGPLTLSAGLGPEAVAVQGLGEHATTRGLSAVIVMRGATKVMLRPEPVWGVNATEILKSAPTARLEGPTPGWSTAGGEAGEVGGSKGPFPLAVAVSWEPKLPAGPAEEDRSAEAEDSPVAQPAETRESRLLVVGDSDILRDDSIDLYGNSALIRRVAGWVGEREYLMTFREIDPTGTPLRIGFGGLRAIFFILELLIPLGMMGVGLFVWIRRR